MCSYTLVHQLSGSLKLKVGFSYHAFCYNIQWLVLWQSWISVITSSGWQCGKAGNAIKNKLQNLQFCGTGCFQVQSPVAGCGKAGTVTFKLAH